jgi:hypothetical protein
MSRNEYETRFITRAAYVVIGESAAFGRAGVHKVLHVTVDTAACRRGVNAQVGGAFDADLSDLAGRAHVPKDGSGVAALVPDQRHIAELDAKLLARTGRQHEVRSDICTGKANETRPSQVTKRERGHQH